MTKTTVHGPPGFSAFAKKGLIGIGVLDHMTNPGLTGAGVDYPFG